MLICKRFPRGVTPAFGCLSQFITNTRMSAIEWLSAEDIDPAERPIRLSARSLSKCIRVPPWVLYHNKYPSVHNLSESLPK